MLQISIFMAVQFSLFERLVCLFKFSRSVAQRTERTQSSLLGRVMILGNFLLDHRYIYSVPIYMVL